MLTAVHHQRLQSLREIFREMGDVLVAFSGGVDSAVVIAVANQVLGARAVALTAISPTFPPEELEEAQNVCGRLGIRHVLVDSNELEVEGYASNKGDRCYFCKSELFQLAADRAQSMGFQWIADGTITDDLGDHRPGLVAAAEQAVRHPLVEAGMDKATVRAIALEMGLPVWDKPSFACLGSRFPVGTRVTSDRVRRIQRVESYLRTVGFRQLRARYHLIEGQAMVRLEVKPSEFAIILEMHDAITEVCQAEGFRWVTLDLMGYRKGNLSLPLAGATAPPT